MSTVQSIGPSGMRTSKAMPRASRSRAAASSSRYWPRSDGECRQVTRRPRWPAIYRAWSSGRSLRRCRGYRHPARRRSRLRCRHKGGVRPPAPTRPNTGSRPPVVRAEALQDGGEPPPLLAEHLEQVLWIKVASADGPEQQCTGPKCPVLRCSVLRRDNRAGRGGLRRVGHELLRGSGRPSMAWVDSRCLLVCPGASRAPR